MERVREVAIEKAGVMRLCPCRKVDQLVKSYRQGEGGAMR